MDVISDLKTGSLHVVGNGFYGHSNLYSATVYLTAQPDGSYKLESTLVFVNEPADHIVGTIQGRHIKFTRTRTNAFVQEYDGWFFERPDPMGHAQMAGTFSHNGVTAYGWYGWTAPLLPK